jgi:hypothetical protein
MLSAWVRRALKKSMTGPPPIDQCSLIRYAPAMVNCSSLIDETGLWYRPTNVPGLAIRWPNGASAAKPILKSGVMLQTP